MEKFYDNIGVKEIHAHIDKLRLKELDKTCKNGSKLIDSIAVTSGIIEYVEGYELINYNDIAETDHRVHMIDINVEDYFKEELNVWNKINNVILNQAK